MLQNLQTSGCPDDPDEDLVGAKNDCGKHAVHKNWKHAR